MKPGGKGCEGQHGGALCATCGDQSGRTSAPIAADRAHHVRGYEVVDLLWTQTAKLVTPASDDGVQISAK
jgi:hypothetical protein